MQREIHKLDPSLRNHLLKLNTAFCIRCVILGLLVFLCVAIFVLCSVPAVSKDALVHHLAVPKLYLKHGGFHEIPSMVFSYYPMNLDLLYLVPLYFGNDIVPKFIHFSFALLTAWLIFYYLRRRIDLTYALGGALFFLSIPIIVKLSITVYVDLGVIFFTTAALLLLFRWVERGFQRKLLMLSAVFCGLAMGTKYNGLISFFLLALFVPFLYSRYAQMEKPGFLKSIGQGLIYAVIAILVFSPWMIRNYIWTSNPIYPLFDHVFNSQHPVIQSSLSLFEIRSGVHHESWWQMVLLPLRIFFQGQDDNPQYFDGQLNPFLLLFPILAYFGIKGDTRSIRIEKKVLLAFAVLYFAFAFFGTSLKIRYISPIIPALVLLCAYGLRNLVDLVKDVPFRLWRRGAIVLSLGIASFPLWLNAVYIYEQYKEVDPVGFVRGSVTPDEYIGKYRYEYPVMRYINDNLPENAKILFIYLGNRGYYCDREYIFDLNFNRSTLHQLVRISNSPEQVLARLRSMGITHLLIRYDIFDPWVKTEFNEKDKLILTAFLEKYVRLLFYKWGYGVSRLEDLSARSVDNIELKNETMKILRFGDKR